MDIYELLDEGQLQPTSSFAIKVLNRPLADLVNATVPSIGYEDFAEFLFPLKNGDVLSVKISVTCAGCIPDCELLEQPF